MRFVLFHSLIPPLLIGNPFFLSDKLYHRNDQNHEEQEICHCGRITEMHILKSFLVNTVNLFNPNNGPINNFLRGIGIAAPPDWLLSTKWALPAIIVVSIWKSAG